VLPVEAAQRGVSAVVERFGATEKRSFAACVFLDQKVFRTREYIFGAISLGPNCFVRDRTMGLKSWTRGLPRSHAFLYFLGLVLGGMFSMILSVVSLFSNSPFCLLQRLQLAQQLAMLWTTGGCKSPANGRLESRRQLSLANSFFLVLIGGGGLEGLPFGVMDFRVDGWWFGGQ
jgi:hypothetical protein